MATGKALRVSIAAMRKIQIYAHERRVPDLLKTLQPLEIIEWMDKADDALIDPSLSSLEDSLHFLNTLFPTPRGMIENFIQIRPLVSSHQVDTIQHDADRLALQLNALEALRIQWESLHTEHQQLTVEAEKLALWVRFRLEPSSLKRLTKTKTMIGFWARADARKWTQQPIANESMIIEIPLSHDEKKVYSLFIYAPKHDAALRAVLQSLQFTEVLLPETEVPFAQRLTDVQHRLKKNTEERASLKMTLRKFLQNEGRHLALWADVQRNKSEISALSRELLHTRKVALMEGWIVSRRSAELDAALKPFENDAFWITATHSEDDIPPVVLRNGVLSPFEAVTNLYSWPLPTEFDPTPWLSVFFALFFGLCMSDAGYGLLLGTISFYLYKRYERHLTNFGKNLLKLMLLCSVPTLAVGILTGSYFSMDLQVIPWPEVRDALLSARITDPVAHPLPLLLFSFFLGAVHIYCGLWIRWLIDWRQKGSWPALWDSGLWVIWITTMIGMGTSSFLKWTFASAIWTPLFYATMAALILTQGRHHKNWLMRLGSGILSLYRLTGFVGDILSYSRLFALGLVTSVLGMVINLLAKMAGEVPFVGFFLLGLLLIVGHLFNFVINILGSFVHPARLQYVEFFSKFFEGGGKGFRPFRWETRYVRVQN